MKMHVACLVFSVLISLFLIATPGHPNEKQAPVWTFDFRDTFYDAAFLNLEDAVIVGARGRILFTHPWHKKLWSSRDSGTKEPLTCLSFTDHRSGWAAGHGGVILHTADAGRTWEVQRKPSLENHPLFDIQFVSNQVGFACGAYDSFLKTVDGGKTWTAHPTGQDYIYNGLAFLDEKTGYLVGEFGTILRTTDGGVSWEKLDPGGYQGSLFGVTLLDPQTILVYGIAGKIMRSEDGGSHWMDLSPDINASLFRAAVNQDEVLVVGASGTHLYSRDGGKIFRRISDKDLTTFAGVCAHPGGGFLCVGERGMIRRFDPSGNN